MNFLRSGYLLFALMLFCFGAFAQDAAPLAGPASTGQGNGYVPAIPTGAAQGTGMPGTPALAADVGTRIANSAATDANAESILASMGGKGSTAKKGTANLGGPVLPANATGQANEFQRFVLAATGNALPIFGAGLFSSSMGADGIVAGAMPAPPGSARYQPQLGVPVPDDYVLGPGDELLIRGSGSIDVDFRAVVDRSGLVNIPKVGTVSLAGVQARNAEAAIRAAFDKVFRGYSLNVTLARLRGITVYVVGQALHPGSYTVSSLSTVVSVLFESGGPNASGSLRHVQVKRDGRLAAELDLYSFLARGDKSMDIRLRDGDVIFFPPAHGYIALLGKVTTPAIYELRGPGDLLQDLLDIAGGVPVVANPNRAYVERIDPAGLRPRTIEQLALDASGLAMPLRNGDVISILPITPEFSNAVTLRGKVSIRVPYRRGMRVTDLIPSKEFLISHDILWQQNGPLAAGSVEPFRAAINRIGRQYEEINWDYAVVERRNPREMSETILPFDLGRALADPAGKDNLVLQEGDAVTVFSADDIQIPHAKRKVFVRIEGEVRRPGVYQVGMGEMLANVIERAGGFTDDAYLFGAEFYRESVRQSQQENLNRFVRRLEQQQVSDTARMAANSASSSDAAGTQLQARIMAEAEARKNFLQRMRDMKSTGRMALNVAPNEANSLGSLMLRLENGDRLVVPHRPDVVQVVGAVNAEAAQFWRPGRSVADYLAETGITRDGDKDFTFVMRANGTVVSGADRWLTSIGGAEVYPGDIIVVPEKPDRESYWTAFARNAKDITQIFANFGLGAAAIHTLSK